MKKFKIFLLIILLCVCSINAQDETLIYSFEEGVGFIIFDTSSYNTNNAYKSGGLWNSTFNKFGNYSLTLMNDIIYMNSIETINNSNSLSFWLQLDNITNTGIIGDNDGYDNYISIKPSSNLFQIETDTNKAYSISYYNTINLSEWNNFVFIFNSYNSSHTELKLYINTLFQNNLIYSNDLILFDRIGYGYALDNSINGSIDEFKLFDFVLNDENIQDLYLNNEIEIIEVEEIEYKYIKKTNNLINSSNIGINYTKENTENLEIKLNYKSNCDLYINNKLTNQYQDVLSFNYELINLLGNTTYFIYCEFINNNTKYYQILDEINFNIIKSINTIDFYIYYDNKPYDLNDKIYITTPCFSDVSNLNYIDNVFINNGMNNVLQVGSFYIQEVKNGKSSFYLNEGEKYDFCLVQGDIMYNYNNFSNDYYINRLFKQKKIGEFKINNLTNIYKIEVTKQDLFKTFNPKFWGKTWESLFGFLSSLVIGGFLIYIGILSELKSLTIIGGLIILGGTGFSISILLW